MANSINLIAFGTFGLPNGFKQSLFLGENIYFFDLKKYDLNTNAIKLFPQSKIYAIRKESLAVKALSYSVYTFAKEKNSDRGGTFIGSSLMFSDSFPNETKSIICLNDFHERLIGSPNNIINDVIQVQDSDELFNSKPIYFDELKQNTKAISGIDFRKPTAENLVVYSPTSSVEKLVLLYQKSLELLNIYQCIYFTENFEVANFVKQKQLFKIIDNDAFEEEILNYRIRKEHETQEKIKKLLEHIECEKRQIAQKQIAQKQEFDAWLIHNKKQQEIHQKNRHQVTSDYQVLTKNLTQYQLNLDNAITLLKSPKPNYEGLKKELDKKRNSLNKELENGKTPSFNTHDTPAYFEIKNEKKADNDLQNPKPKNQDLKLDYYKLASFVLLLLWLGTLVCFLFFQEKAEQALPVIEEISEINSLIKPVIEDSLQPKPNAEISRKELKTLVRKIKFSVSINDVINEIYKKNPNDVQKHYASQMDLYKVKLLELNPNSFEKKDHTYIYKKDSLRHIPIYKK